MKKTWAALVVLMLTLWMGMAAALADGQCEHPEEALRWEHDTTRHWEVCTLCGMKGEFGNPPLHVERCDAPGVCGICGATDGIFTEIWYTASIIHPVDALVWEHDDYNHWLVCTICGEMEFPSYEEHEIYCDAPDTCSVCGATGVEPWFPGVYRHRDDAMIWKYDGKSHWKACSLCGVTNQSKDSHEVYCDAPDVCSVCGATGLALSPKDYQHRESALTWEHNDKEHWQVCTLCGNKVGKSLPHYSYCYDPGVCHECGAVNMASCELKHPWGTQMEEFNDEQCWWVCSLCGEISGERMNHRFYYHEYELDHTQHICKCEMDCGYVRGPEPPFHLAWRSAWYMFFLRRVLSCDACHG